MALDAKHRSSIYNKLLPTLGEDDANALMTEFPSSEADELVTKDFLRAELALTASELRSEMADLGGALRSEMVDMRGETGNLETSLRGEIAGLRVDIADLRNELTLRLIAVVATATAMLGTLITLT